MIIIHKNFQINVSNNADQQKLMMPIKGDITIMEQYKDVIIRVNNIRSYFPYLVHYNMHKLYKKYERDANSPDPKYDDYDSFCYMLCERFKRYIKEYGFPVNKQSLNECRKLADSCYYNEISTSYIVYFRYAFNDTIPDETYMVLTLDELARLEAIHNIISSWLGYDIYPELQIIE